MWWKAVSKQATCGKPGRSRASARMPARLWGWCRAQRNQTFQLRENVFIDPHRMDVVGAAMHHAMPGGVECLAAVAGFQPVQYLI
jgi:hypothetical protein